MSVDKLPRLLNWINGCAVLPRQEVGWLDKLNPHTGCLLYQVIDSSEAEVHEAVSVATQSFKSWSHVTPVKRGQILTDIAALMKQRAAKIRDCISIETGKSEQDAAREVDAAILQAEYFAGEGMRLYGRSIPSGMPGKYTHIIRQPLGVAGLIVPANTPIANIAWKTFPALICGNTVVLKASEDAPRTALLFAELTQEAGLPDGVFNVIQGSGKLAGAALVQHEGVSILSFTGSTAVGRWIAQVGGQRFARISLELGGKNPFVVCDDANLDEAVRWAVLSAYSNAGQRCAAGSRLIIFKAIYEQFRDKFLSHVSQLKLGVSPGCDLGPLINKNHQQSVLNDIASARRENARVLCGGDKPQEPELANGFYVQPTVIEELNPEAILSDKEIFGPVVMLYEVKTMQEALDLANCTQYGLTAAIHTQSVDRAMWFAQRVRAGVANVNLGTFGSEPHMPFGGFGFSGNGTREPGVEALDVYSELKNISFFVREQAL